MNPLAKKSPSVPNFSGTPGKNDFLENNKIIIGLIVLLIIAIGIVAFVLVLKKPVKKAVPAQENVSAVCQGEPGQTQYGWRIVHTFSSAAECNACNNDSQCKQQWVGELKQCFISQNSCSQVDSCKIGSNGTCQVNSSVPLCSVVQLDCVNQPYPTPGSITAGGIAINCTCAAPTSPPTSTNTPTPTSPQVPTNTPTPTVPGPSLTPTPTVTGTPPSGTPTLTSAPSPTPTEGPGPSATPIPLACGSKACDNTTNPCGSGLICVQANDGSNYCTFPEFQNTCKQNPSQVSCCTAPGNSPTPTEIILARNTSTPGPSATAAPQTTQIPSAGVATYGQIFAIISLGIIVFGLIL